MENECTQVLKDFYELGNLKLDIEKRHRKKKKGEDQDILEQ